MRWFFSHIFSSRFWWGGFCLPTCFSLHFCEVSHFVAILSLRFWWGDFLYSQSVPFDFLSEICCPNFLPLDFGEVIFYSHIFRLDFLRWIILLTHFLPLDFGEAFFFTLIFSAWIFWGEVFCSNFSFRFWWSDFLYSQIFPLDFLRWFLCGELFYSYSFLYILLRQAWLLLHFIFQCFAEVNLYICQEVVLALLLLRLAKGYPPLLFLGVGCQVWPVGVALFGGIIAIAAAKELRLL